jgi:hypothetical protein
MGPLIRVTWIYAYRIDPNIEYLVSAYPSECTCRTSRNLDTDVVQIDVF